MRRTMLVMGLMAAGLAMAADDATLVRLEGVQFQEQGESVSATGTCGAATVSIRGLGWVEDGEGGRRLAYGMGGAEDGGFDILTPAKTLTQADFITGDSTRFLCVPTDKGPRLIVRAECWSPSCVPIDWQAADPDTGAIANLGRPSDGMEGCDEACAAKRLGAKVDDLAR